MGGFAVLLDAGCDLGGVFEQVADLFGVHGFDRFGLDTEGDEALAVFELAAGFGGAALAGAGQARFVVFSSSRHGGSGMKSAGGTG